MDGVEREVPRLRARFLAGRAWSLGEFAFRLTGSSDLYKDDGRRPHASINFVTAHDGFTLHDLVSYDQKHNEANGEGNRDGESQSLVELRRRGTERRSRGRCPARAAEAQLHRHAVPIAGRSDAVHGDELGRTQRGNNNGYCQDNEITWVDWADVREHWTLREFTETVTRLRAEHPVFRRRRFFRGRPIYGSPDGLTDIQWLTPSGDDMANADWSGGHALSMGMFLNGDAISEPDARGPECATIPFCCCSTPTTTTLSSRCRRRSTANSGRLRWTPQHRSSPIGPLCKAGGTVDVEARSLLVFRRVG